MRYCKKIASILLVLILALGLWACGKEPEPESELYGCWTYRFDLAGLIDQEMESQLGESLPVDAELVLPMIFTFNQDKTFSLELDGAEMKVSFGVYKDALKTSVVEYMYKQAEDMDMTREDFDAAFQDAYGSTVEEYCGELLESLLDDSMIDDLASEESGVYRVKDGKLFVAETEEDLDEETYLSYTVDGDNLTIASVSGGALELDSLGMGFPMTFEKRGSVN